MSMSYVEAEHFMRMAEAFFEIPCLPRYTKSTKPYRDLVLKIYEYFHTTTETQAIRGVIWQAAEEELEAEAHE
jgi:hypothetical protein